MIVLNSLMHPLAWAMDIIGPGVLWRGKKANRQFQIGRLLTTSFTKRSTASLPPRSF